MMLTCCKGQMYTEGLREGCGKGDRLILLEVAFREIIEAHTEVPESTIFYFFSAKNNQPHLTMLFYSLSLS